MPRMMTRYQHRYLPETATSSMRCFHCDHFFPALNRCGLIAVSEGQVTSCGWCRRWHGRAVLLPLYRNVPPPLKAITEPPDLGPLFSKREVGFVRDVDRVWMRCVRCRFHLPPATCSLMRTDYCNPAGVCCDWKSIPKKWPSIKRIWKVLLTLFRWA